MKVCADCGDLLTEDDVLYCCMCGKPICEDCARTPDPGILPEGAEEGLDYCLDDYAKAGFADLWEVEYRTIHGDKEKIVLDVPPGTSTFRVIANARQSNPLWRYFAGCHKIKFEGN